MRNSVPLIALLGVLLVPASAGAQQCNAPAGLGAVDEYCETIPAATGERDAGAGSGGERVSDDTTAAIAARGEDGQALVRALGKQPTDRRSPRDEAPAAEPARVPQTPSSNPLTAVSQAIGGSETIGSPFFMALLGVVLLTLGAAWVGWRRSSS